MAGHSIPLCYLVVSSLLERVREAREMTTYTVAMATFYNSEWHIDRNTESVMMDATSVIEEGHKLAALGAVPFYTEYINGKRSGIMVEGPTGLEYAFLTL